MAIQVIPDVREHANVVEDTNGITVVRGFQVNGLTPGSGTLLEAMSASGVPQYGDPHPDRPDIYVARREPKPYLNANDQAWVIVQYRPSDLSNIQSPIVRFTGTTREVQTSFDADGVRIQVAYDPKITNGDGPDPITPANSRTGRVGGHKAFGVLTVDQIVYEDPSPKMVFLNTINSSNVPRTSRSGAGGCGTYTIEKQLYRSGWREHWEIELDGDLYSKAAVWRDLNGEIPENVYGGLPIDKSQEAIFNAVTIARVNGEMDFNAIGLPTGF
jgi:hypothetical protein